MSDSSYPHRPDPNAPDGAQVLDFPSEEVSSPSRPVPAGTWASDEADAAQSTQRPLRRTAEGGQVVAFPRSSRIREAQGAVESAPAAKPRDPEQRSEERPLEPPATPGLEAQKPPELEERPRFLATELLREEWYPEAPLARTLRWGSVAIGACGLFVALALGGLDSKGIALATIFAVCGALGAFPLPARVRGFGLALAGLGGAGATSFWQLASDELHEAPLLIACATLTASALFFRAAHRQSKLARVLVALGLIGVGAWLVLSGGVDALIIQSLDWRAWLEPVLRLALAAALLLALLSFLDPSGHGGAWITGATVLAWLAVHAGALLVLDAFPAGREALVPDHALLTATTPLFVAVAAGGLCAVLAALSRVLHARAFRSAG